ncbi:hypothetical protein [Mycobacterium sp. URHB0044]|uniref:hypothetical protein n=1 Tax=Mycobacterium sp. URHB0044 TaxID=1380386 RepID=UPI0009DE1A9D|nr:hypothetical protein [Mycobacterium sp. URHB0044]
MTDQAPGETPLEAPSVHVDAPEGTPSGDDTPKQNKEARYRVERNEARTERDLLAARVASFQNREVERLAANHLSAPADLLTLGGVALADLLDDDGDIDPELVAAVAAEVLASRPGLSPRVLATDPTQGRGNTAVRSLPTFQDLLQS